MAGMSTESYAHDNLIWGHGRTPTRPVTLQSGQNLARGSVIGKLQFAAGTPVAGGGNTGDGTVTGVAPAAKSVVGDYILTCVEVIANGGRFRVEDPDGNALADAYVGTAYSNEFIAFTINDGATDFALDDTFTVPIAAHADAGEYVLSLAAATDGSQIPDLILAEDTDASAAAVLTNAYEAGTFNERELTYGTGHDKDTVAAAFDLYRQEMKLRDSVSQ